MEKEKLESKEIAIWKKSQKEQQSQTTTAAFCVALFSPNNKLSNKYQFSIWEIINSHILFHAFAFFAVYSFALVRLF